MSASPGSAPPAAGGRWFGTRVLLAAFSIQAIALGFSIGLYPVFMLPIESEFGQSRALMSLGLPVALIAAALCSPFIGRLVDRGHPRPLMMVGVLMLAAGLALAGWAPNFAVLALCWIVLVGIGKTVCGPLPAMTVLANWFVARRNTMIALAAMGTTAGSALTPPVAEWLIAELGWRGAFMAFGAAAAILGLPVIAFGIVGRPEDGGLFPDGAAAPPGADRTSPAGSAARPLEESAPASIAADPRFWFLGVGLALMSGLGVAFLTHLIPFAEERGITREQAVLLLSVNAIASAIGKLVFGGLTDRRGPLRAVWGALGSMWLGWGLMLFGTAPAFAAGAALFALGGGAMIPCQSGFIAELFGRERFGRAMGLLGPVAMAGPLVFPLVIGAAYDAQGSYQGPMTSVWLVLLVPALLFYFASPERGPRPAEQPA